MASSASPPTPLNLSLPGLTLDAVRSTIQRRQQTSTILNLMDLCGEHFAGPSWRSWRVILKALFALPFDPDSDGPDSDLAIYQRLTGRTTPPTTPPRELWAACGRRGGKSRIAALVATYVSIGRTYNLAPGEQGLFLCCAVDKAQASIIHGYISGLLNSHPLLQQYILKERATEIDLTNQVTIRVKASDQASVRGYTVIGTSCDEIAFWPTDAESASPDKDVLNAIRPATATIPDALLMCLSNPYAQRGELYRNYRAHYGIDDDPILVVSADTRSLNPLIPSTIIDTAFADDPSSAWAEYGRDGEIRFRTDVESFIGVEALEQCTVNGRLELPHIASHHYHAFVDFAGGSGEDSAALAIAHLEPTSSGQPVAVLDLIREDRPPFSPNRVCDQYAAIIKQYNLARATADRYAGQFPVERMRLNGVKLRHSKLSKSDIYADTLPSLNSATCELLDHARMRAQFVGLERRTARGGRDSIDHQPNGHDDVANVVAGALLLARTKRGRKLNISGRAKGSGGAGAGPRALPSRPVPALKLPSRRR